jgi:hypothetical protein
MSDEQPASFGATTGQGEWNLPAVPTGSDERQRDPGQLETAATAAYKKGK